MFDTCPPKNQHPLEQALRVILGAALVSLLFVGPRTQWGALGFLLLGTGLSGRCPLYMLLGTGTRGLGGRKLRAPDSVVGPGPEQG